MKNSTTKILGKLLAAQKGQKTKQQNKELAIERKNLYAFNSIFSPLKKIVEKWNKSPILMVYLRAVFKNYGLYNQGNYLLEIFTQKEKSPNFSIFLFWNVREAKVGVSVLKTLFKDNNTIVDKEFKPTEFGEWAQNLLKNIVNISEKELLSALVKNYPIEENNKQPILSRKAIDMTREHSWFSGEDEWKIACFELSPTGYHDGRENIYRVLATAEEELLVDKQKIIVFGTNITREAVDELGERYLVSKRVTIGLLRRMFFQDYKKHFTLEWYRDHADYRLTCAMLQRNRMPIIMLAA